ncbi:MAG: universal stress protein [Candidatus Phosphoribacter sp.]|nr:universal stress protein [Actinomycetales bacterium]
MSTVPSRTVPYQPGLSGDVVAGLLNDGHAEGVARAAVGEAVRRGARLRFVQVVDEGLSAQERADADQATFRAAVRALRGVRGIPCRFEVVTGDPTPTLLELTRGAAALIVGDDQDTGQQIARRCIAHAECPVVTVPFHAA